MVMFTVFSSREKFKGFIAVVGLALLSVLIGITTRYLSKYFPLYQQIYLRIFTAFILGFIVFGKSLHFRKICKISPKEWLLLVSRSCLSFILGAPLWVTGFSAAKLANASFIDSIPMSAVMGFIILRERISVRKITLLFLAFLGVVLISITDLSNIFIWGRGELLILVSNIFFSIRSVTRRFHSSLLNDQEIVQLIHFFGFIFLFIISLSIGEGLPLDGWNPELFFAVLIAGMMNVGIMFFMNYGYARIDASLAANTLQLESAFGIILGFFLYGEFPSLRSLFGGVFIVTSVILMNRKMITNINNTPEGIHFLNSSNGL